MSLTGGEKAYIAMRMLSSNPANGLSPADYRRKVGVRTADSKSTLADEVTRLMGGLSETEAARILATAPYLNVDPANLVLGKNLIDHSEMNSQLLKRKNKFGNMQEPRIDRELPGLKEAFLDPNSRQYQEQFPFDDPIPQIPQNHDFGGDGEYDDGFYQGSELPRQRKAVRVNKAGKVIKPRSKSEWNKFVQKVSKWQSLSTMGLQKMKALSLLYAEANTCGDLKQFVKLEFIEPAEMKRRLKL